MHERTRMMIDTEKVLCPYCGAEMMKSVQGCTSHWISVDDALPEMPTVGEKGFIVYDGRKVTFLLYERATVRGKTVCRWKYPWVKLYDGPAITHWMPLPGAPA